jgi:type IV secretion system protein VirD4
MANTRTSSFNPEELRNGKMTIYLVIPPELMRSHMALLRMWVGSLLRACVRGGLQQKHRINFILDEAASLGHLETVDDAVDKYRGYGIRLQFYFQDLGQLPKCFPEGQGQTLLANCTQVFFGVNEKNTAEYVSARLGEETIIVTSGGSNTGFSRQTGQGGQGGSVGISSGASDNWAQMAHKLLNPAQVAGLHERTAITFVQGLPPICTFLKRYYEDQRKPNGYVKAFSGAIWMLLITGALAFLVTMAAQRDRADAPASTNDIGFMP